MNKILNIVALLSAAQPLLLSYAIDTSRFCPEGEMNLVFWSASLTCVDYARAPRSFQVATTSYQ